MRAAIYYAPDPSDPLWPAAAAWLGRDAETAARVPQPALADIGDLTRAPSIYGFHATLKPPMRLRTSYRDLLDDVRKLAETLPPFELPQLSVKMLGGFLALRENAPSRELHRLADRCVTELDEHRAPAGAEELSGRRAGGLSPEQENMLLRWGYPHVLDTWFFHMTLTRRLSEAEREAVVPAAEAHFAEALRHRRRVESLAVFTQAGPGAPFLVAERVRLRGGAPEA